MNLKYYIRGIGVGIIFTAAVMSAAFHASSKQGLTNEQIKEKAKELGMVEKGSVDSLADLLNTSTPTPTELPEENNGEAPQDTDPADDGSQDGEAQNTDTQNTDTQNTDTQNTDATGTDPESSDKENPGSQDTASGETGSEDTNNPDSENGAEGDDEKAGIDITEGMTSEQVANLLKSQGIIEDSGAFNQYLVINNYTRKIRIGNYEIKPYATYKEITDMIIDK